MNEDYILLTGIKNPEKLDAYFASSLVDIAYAEDISAGKMKIFVESTTDLRKEDDVNSIIDLVVDALRKNGEDEYTTEVILAPKK